MATIEDLKKLDTTVLASATKTDKNSNEIKNLFSMFDGLSRNIGKGSSNGGTDDQVNGLTARVEKVENSLTAIRKLIDDLRLYLNK